MKIFILRHEDRTQDATFFSPLTQKGLENANNLIEHLEKLNIRIIYSSPFIRTLQTIYPYAKHSGNKIKLEYALGEIQHGDIIPKASYQVRLPEYLAKLFHYDSGYQTHYQPENYNYPETEKNVTERVKIFLRQLIAQYGNTEENILLVTHQEICRVILRIVKKYGLDKPGDELLVNYPTGAISQVFEGTYWFFKPINYKPTKH